MLELAKPALDLKTPVRATLPIRNTNRVVGTMTGSEVTRDEESAEITRATTMHRRRLGLGVTRTL